MLILFFKKSFVLVFLLLFLFLLFFREKGRDAGRKNFRWTTYTINVHTTDNCNIKFIGMAMKSPLGASKNYPNRLSTNGLLLCAKYAHFIVTFQRPCNQCSKPCSQRWRSCNQRGSISCRACGHNASTMPRIGGKLPIKRRAIATCNGKSPSTRKIRMLPLP